MAFTPQEMIITISLGKLTFYMDENAHYKGFWTQCIQTDHNKGKKFLLSTPPMATIDVLMNKPKTATLKK